MMFAQERPYLDESSLGRFLRERLDAEIISNARVPTIGRAFRPDYRSEKHKLIIEFDGDQRYRSANHVIEDKTRDQILTDAGYEVIRIPYFVQMTEPVITLLFGNHLANRNRFKDFPHGFIADTVIFPADFSELGVGRFLEDLGRFAVIRIYILASLQRAEVARRDWRLVYPPSIRNSLVSGSEASEAG
jgi:very-short-patch-repair endonuclease